MDHTTFCPVARVLRDSRARAAKRGDFLQKKFRYAFSGAAMPSGRRLFARKTTALAVLLLAARAGILPCAAAESWSERAGGLVREATELEARLMTGGVGGLTVEAAPQLEVLVQGGEALLGEHAGDAFTKLQEAGLALGEANTAAVEAVRRAKVSAAGERLSALRDAGGGEGEPDLPKLEGVTIDPWGGVDQECGYFPAGPLPVTTEEGEACDETETGDLARLIPARYRQAEALGVGRLRVVCRPGYTDLMQDRLPSDRWKVVIRARLQCELTVQFAALAPPPLGETGSGRTAANLPPPATALRLAVTSQGRVPAAFNNTELPPGFVRQYSLGEHRPTDNVTNRKGNRPWVREALPAAAAKRGWILTPVPGADSTDNSGGWVKREMQKKLSDLRKATAPAVRQDSEVSRGMGALREARAKFLEAAAEAEKSAPGIAAPALSRAVSLLRAMDLEGRVESGQLDPVTLDRMPPATARVTRSVIRAARAVAVPEADRSMAVQLAITLDSLETWKQRP